MTTVKKEKIMIFGTFDFLHKGHLHFFQQARKLSKNPFLVVSVARDINVKKIKGQLPLQKENERVREIKKCPLVDRVVLGGLKNYIPHIKKERPDIIALGYDQIAYTENLQKNLAKHGLVIKISRLKSYKPHVYKSSILKK